MDAEFGSRALSAANDLVELHGAPYEQAEVERTVSREETATVWRGHPLRRAADRGNPSLGAQS